MNVDNIVKELQEIRVKYPSLTNDEILKLLELAYMKDANSVARSKR